MPKRNTRKLAAAKMMMGTNGDSPNQSDLSEYDYKGSKSGAWTNKNGTQVGHSYQEDSAITPMKSTGDTASPRFANAARTKRIAKTKFGNMPVPAPRKPTEHDFSPKEAARLKRIQRRG